MSAPFRTTFRKQVLGLGYMETRCLFHDSFLVAIATSCDPRSWVVQYFEPSVGDAFIPVVTTWHLATQAEVEKLLSEIKIYESTQDTPVKREFSFRARSVVRARFPLEGAK